MPLIKFKQADHKSFQSFIDALKWMLDKQHMQPVTASETEDEDDGVSYLDDTEDEGPPPSPSPSPPPTTSRRPMHGASTPTPSRASSPTKPLSRSSSPVKQEVPTARLPVVTEDRTSAQVSSPWGPRFRPSTLNVESPAVPLERAASSPAAYLSASYSISSAPRAHSVRRTAPFLGAGTSPFAGASASAARARFPSAMDAAAGVSFRARSMASLIDSFFAAISISDDEDSSAQSLTARDLQRVLRPATMGPDGVLIDGSPVAYLGREAELFCDGLRMPSSHRTLVLQVYIFSASCEEFTRTLSRAPVNLTLGEGEKLWDALAAAIPPSV